MHRAQDVRKQIQQMMDRYRLPLVSCGKNYNKIRKAIVAGYFAKAARKDPQENGYKTLVEGTPVYIHPGSAIYKTSPQWVVYHELVCYSPSSISSPFFSRHPPLLLRIPPGLVSPNPQQDHQPLFLALQIANWLFRFELQKNI